MLRQKLRNATNHCKFSTGYALHQPPPPPPVAPQQFHVAGQGFGLLPSCPRKALTHNRLRPQSLLIIIFPTSAPCEHVVQHRFLPATAPPNPSLPIEVSSNSVWIECHTLDGHKLFHDLLTKTSRWELPSPPPRVASIPLPSGPPPLKQVHRARGGAANKTPQISAQVSLADRAPVDFESALREKRQE
jgi:hypothetical protein